MRWRPIVLLGAAGVLLTSLYLPWQEASCDAECKRGRGGVADLLHLFSGGLRVDGLSSGVGEAAAMSALLLVALAALAWARPDLADRLPIGVAAVAAAYFAVAVAAATRSDAHQREIGIGNLDFSSAYGAYVGIAAAGVVLGTAGAMRREILRRYRSSHALLSIAIGAVLLVAVLLPWARFTEPGAVTTFLGIGTPAAVLAAALALYLLGTAWRQDELGTFAACIAATGVLTAGAFSSLPFSGARAYGAWIGLGAAVALAALAIAAVFRLRRLQLPGAHALTMGAAAALLIVALFLPWQEACYAQSSDFGELAGHCVSIGGWSIFGAAAGLLAIALAMITLTGQRLVPPIVLAAGISVLVATSGSRLESTSGDGFRLEHGTGSLVAFASAGLLLALAALPLRLRRFGSERVPVLLVPIAASIAYLGVVVLPWWGVLPRGIESALRFAPVSWLTVTGVLLGIWLAYLWAERASAVTAGVSRLVIVPVLLLALAALDIVRFRDEGITWGRGAVVALCLLLAALGRIEQRGGLESFRIPDVLRVDRL